MSVPPQQPIPPPMPSPRDFAEQNTVNQPGQHPPPIAPPPMVRQKGALPPPKTSWGIIIALVVVIFSVLAAAITGKPQNAPAPPSDGVAPAPAKALMGKPNAAATKAKPAPVLKSKPIVHVNPAPSKLKTGITYAQISVYLDRYFDMQSQGALANGEAHYMAQSHDKLDIFEVIGDKEDITSSSLTIGIAKDLTFDQKLTESLMYTRFIKNCDPSWVGAAKWAGRAMASVTDSTDDSPSTSTVRGHKKITVTYYRSLGMLIASVEANHSLRTAKKNQ